MTHRHATCPAVLSRSGDGWCIVLPQRAVVRLRNRGTLIACRGPHGTLQYFTRWQWVKEEQRLSSLIDSRGRHAERLRSAIVNSLFVAELSPEGVLDVPGYMGEPLGAGSQLVLVLRPDKVVVWTRDEYEAPVEQWRRERVDRELK